MAAFYTDEDTPASLVNFLITLGHDVLTASADHRANQGIADTDVLARATALGRAVLTFNRRDFHRLHRSNPAHGGIITCTDDPDRLALAQRIDQAVRTAGAMAGQLIKIIRPSRC
jgi:hypothetical protein